MAGIDQQQDQTFIDSVVNETLGTAQQGMQQAQQQAAQAQQQAMNTPGADPKNPQEKPTAMEKAAATASPQTEGDKSNMDAMTFIDVDFGDGQMRRLSPNQIKDTFQRYRDLNYRHQTQVAPNQQLLEMATQIQEAAAAQGYQVGPAEVVQLVQTALNAMVHNAQMGGQPTQPTQVGLPVPHDMEMAMQQWEQENAISLPPAYRQAAAQMTALQNDNAQLKQMMMQILQQAQGVQGQVQQQVVDAHQAQIQNMRSMAANNLNSAQQRYQLPDEAENDFFTYAFERGYTIEDFVDPRLTDKVVSDFRNNMNSGEMERLRLMAQRRTAFTGNVGTQPTANGRAPAADANQAFIDTVTQDIMKKRNMV